MFKSLLKLIVWVVILACVFVGFCYYNTGKLPFGLDKYPFLRELATKLPVKAQKPNSPRGTNRAAHSPATTPSKLSTSSYTTSVSPTEKTVTPSTAATSTKAGQSTTVADDDIPEIIPCSNGVYSLFEAALAGDMEVLKARLSEGIDIAKGNELGQTPLHLASIGDHIEAMQALIKAGASVLSKDKAGYTPLDLAKSDAARNLLRKTMARLEQDMKLFSNMAGLQPDVLRGALQSGTNPNMASRDGKSTLLGEAIVAGNEPAVTMLLQAGANANAVRADGKTMLHVAAVQGTPGIVKALLQAGANPMAKGGNGAFPIHDAVWRGRTDNLRALLPAYKNVNFSPDGGRNSFPIIMAILRGNKDAVQAFLEAGLNVNAPMFAKQPPLIAAVKNGREDIVKLLLQAGANKGAKDADGKTAADYAKGPILKLLK